MGIVAESEDSKKDRCEWNRMGLVGTRDAPDRIREEERISILTLVALSGSLFAQLFAILHQS